MDANDCDLVHGLRRKVMSSMSVEVLARDVSCSQAPQRLRPLRFKARVLAPANELTAASRQEVVGSGGE